MKYCSQNKYIDNENSKRFLSVQRFFGGILLLALTVTLPVFGQNRQEKAKDLIFKTLAALGGQSFLGIRTLKKTGRAYSFYRQNLRGRAVMTVFEEFKDLRKEKDPDWLPISRREVYTKKGNYFTLFRNGEGWEVTYLGARPLPSETIHRYRVASRRDIFYILRYRLEESGMYYYYLGTDIVDNTPAHAIDISDQNNETITVYIRVSDNLPVKQIHTRRDPKTRIPYEEKSIYSKYRKVGSVTLPWNIQKQRDGNKIFEFFGRTLDVNSQIKPGMFDIDRKTKLLPQKR